MSARASLPIVPFAGGVEGTCERCTDTCCEGDMQAILNRDEVDRIAAALGRDDFYAARGEAFALRKQPDGACVFYSRQARRCEIHELRPDDCRLHPLDVTYDEERETYHLVLYDCLLADHVDRDQALHHARQVHLPRLAATLAVKGREEDRFFDSGAYTVLAEIDLDPRGTPHVVGPHAVPYVTPGYTVQLLTAPELDRARAAVGLPRRPAQRRDVASLALVDAATGDWAGLAALERPAWDAERVLLVHCAVAAGQRRRGLGAALVARALAEGRSRGASKLVASGTLPGGEGAVAFWERCGFRRDGTLRDYGRRGQDLVYLGREV